MAKPVLRVEELSKHYGKRTVIDRVSFSMERGEIAALLGGNGAGKTTMLRCMLGITAFGGEVFVSGHSVRKQGKRARRSIGYVPQLPSMDEGERAEDALAFAADLKGAPRSDVTRVLEAVNLTADRGMRVGELSGGMRQRLAMGAALLGDPELLLLDEPTASLDARSRLELEEILLGLRDTGKTILLSTHVLDRAEGFVSRALVLRDGALVFDGPFDELAGRAHGRRYVVDLDGQSPDAFLRAVRDLGVAAQSVQRAPASWDDIVEATMGESGEER